jgi:hypothetical protein
MLVVLIVFVLILVLICSGSERIIRKREKVAGTSIIVDSPNRSWKQPTGPPTTKDTNLTRQLPSVVVKKHVPAISPSVVNPQPPLNEKNPPPVVKDSPSVPVERLEKSVEQNVVKSNSENLQQAKVYEHNGIFKPPPTNDDEYIDEMTAEALRREIDDLRRELVVLRNLVYQNSASDVIRYSYQDYSKLKVGSRYYTNKKKYQNIEYLAEDVPLIDSLLFVQNIRLRTGCFVKDKQKLGALDTFQPHDTFDRYAFMVTTEILDKEVLAFGVVIANNIGFTLGSYKPFGFELDTRYYGLVLLTGNIDVVVPIPESLGLRPTQYRVAYASVQLPWQHQLATKDLNGVNESIKKCFTECFDYLQEQGIYYLIFGGNFGMSHNTLLPLINQAVSKMKHKTTAFQKFKCTPEYGTTRLDNYELYPYDYFIVHDHDVSEYPDVLFTTSSSVSWLQGFTVDTLHKNYPNAMGMAAVIHK